jgi:hypothetical protein
MARITITLAETQLEKIKTLAEQRSITLSHCSTHLIDLGLHVEDASRQPKALVEGTLTSSPHIQQPNKQWQKLLTWSLESRYLIRYLIMRSSQESVKQRNAFTVEAKQKASDRVIQFIKDTQGQ